MQKYHIVGFGLLIAGIIVLLVGANQYHSVPIPTNCNATPACVASVHSQWQQALYVVIAGMVLTVGAAIIIGVASFRKKTGATTVAPQQDLNSPFQ